MAAPTVGLVVADVNDIVAATRHVQVYICGWALSGLVVAVGYSFLDTVSVDLELSHRRHLLRSKLAVTFLAFALLNLVSWLLHVFYLSKNWAETSRQKKAPVDGGGYTEVGDGEEGRGGTGGNTAAAVRSGSGSGSDSNDGDGDTTLVHKFVAQLTNGHLVTVLLVMFVQFGCAINFYNNAGSMAQVGYCHSCRRIVRVQDVKCGRVDVLLIC